jgi:hypothetical protein
MPLRFTPCGKRVPPANRTRTHLCHVRVALHVLAEIVVRSPDGQTRRLHLGTTGSYRAKSLVIKRHLHGEYQQILTSFLRYPQMGAGCHCTSRSMSSFSFTTVAANSSTSNVSAKGSCLSSSSTLLSRPSLLYVTAFSGCASPPPIADCFFSFLAARSAASSACNSTSSPSFSDSYSSAFLFLLPSFFPMLLI